MNRVFGLVACSLIAAGGIAEADPFGIYLRSSTSAGGAAGTADYATGPGVSIYSIGGLATTLDAFSAVNPTSMPLGLTTGQLTVTTTSPVTRSTGVATSGANLAQGALRVLADSAGTLVGCGGTCGESGIRAIALSELVDSVTFTITDSAVSAPVTVHVHMDGVADTGASVLGYYADLLQLNFLGNFAFQADPTGYSNNGAGSTPPQGWTSFSFTNESTTGFDFTGVANVTDGQVSNLFMAMQADCSSSANCDFRNTGALSLDLPSNVTLHSASGVLLTQPLVATPEPGTLALLATAVVALGVLRRRRSAQRLW